MVIYGVIILLQTTVQQANCDWKRAHTQSNRCQEQTLAYACRRLLVPLFEPHGEWSQKFQAVF